MVNRISHTVPYNHRTPLGGDRHAVYLGVAADRQPSRTGLRDAIRRLIAVSRICGGPEIEFYDEGLANQLRPELQAALSEVLRELLLNAICYSESKSVSVRIARGSGALQICVRDRGTGCDPLSIVPYRRGLNEIRELVNRLGGSMNMDNRHGVGASVCLDIPLPRERSAGTTATTNRKPR